VAKGMPAWMLQLLCEQLEISGSEDVFELEGPLALRDLTQLTSVPLPSLRYPPWNPVVPGRLQRISEDSDIFATLNEGDVLVHQPYDAVVCSVQLVMQCA